MRKPRIPISTKRKKTMKHGDDKQEAQEKDKESV